MFNILPLSIAVFVSWKTAASCKPSQAFTNFTLACPFRQHSLIQHAISWSETGKTTVSHFRHSNSQLQLLLHGYCLMMICDNLAGIFLDLLFQRLSIHE